MTLDLQSRSALRALVDGEKGKVWMAAESWADLRANHTPAPRDIV